MFFVPAETDSVEVQNNFKMISRMYDLLLDSKR